MVDLFLLVTVLKCCRVLFPLLSNSAQKRVEILIFKVRSSSYFLCSQNLPRNKDLPSSDFAFIGSYIATKVIVLRLNFCALLIRLFKILHTFARWTTVTWPWDNW